MMWNDFWLWLQEELMTEAALSLRRKRRAAERLGIQTKSVQEVVRELEVKLAQQGKGIPVSLNYDFSKER